MLVLTFQVDGIAFAVPVTQVVEVIPRVALRPVPHAPPCFLGLLRYRGGAVPVVDLGLLLGRSACVDRLDTRILLVRTGRRDGSQDWLGLLAEQVNELADVATIEGGMRTPGIINAPYLGAVYETPAGLLQLIDPAKISVAAAPELPGVVAS